MVKLIARDLINVPREQLPPMLPREFTLVFDDGEMQVTDRQTIYSHVFWQYHREYPNTPMLMKHHVKVVLGGKPLNSDTHLKLINNIFRDVVAAYNIVLPEQQDRLQQLVCETTNDVYNYISVMSLENVSSIDITHFKEIIKTPGVQIEDTSKIRSHKDIESHYNKAISIMMNDPKLANNGIVKALKAKMINTNQVLQCVVARGFQTEVSGDIFRYPIISNYAGGMSKLYDLVAESRTAEKAYRFSETPLKDSEYIARRFQILASSVEHIDYQDCGSTEYLLWFVNPPKYDENGNMEYEGDLPRLVGKYYVNPDNPSELLEIKGDEQHIVGTTIKLRSVFHCKCKNPHNVCHICFGALSRNVDRWANIGHMSSATMTQQSSQKILSTKHVDALGNSVDIKIPKEAQMVLETNKEKNMYLIKKYLKDKKPEVVFMRNELMGLIDAVRNDNPKNINVRRIGSISYIEMRYTEKNGKVVSAFIQVNVGSKKAILSKEMLDYIRIGNRWRTDDKNNFVVDLSEWKFGQPFLTLPDKEYNYQEHIKQIAKKVESATRKTRKNKESDSLSKVLQDLFVLVNSKLNVNIVCLEVLLYGASTPSFNSYGLSRGSSNPVLRGGKTVIKNRSESAALAFENMTDTITNPETFFATDRPSSVFDVFIDPAGVISRQV